MVNFNGSNHPSRDNPDYWREHLLQTRENTALYQEIIQKEITIAFARKILEATLERTKDNRCPADPLKLLMAILKSDE